MEVSRFDIVSLRQDDAESPCVVISPNEMNAHLSRVIVAPLYEKMLAYPTRVGGVALEEMRAVDKAALSQKLGRIREAAARDICAVLGEMFRY